MALDIRGLNEDIDALSSKILSEMFIRQGAPSDGSHPRPLCVSASISALRLYNSCISYSYAVYIMLIYGRCIVT